MSDRPPTGDQQDTGSRDSDGLSVAAVADRLGLTPDAVRGRLHRGTLVGYKAGNEWRVFLPDAEGATGHRQDATAEQQPVTGDRQATAPGRQATDRPEDAPLVALVANLARRNEELASAAAMWQARAASLEERVRALGAGQDAPAAAPAATGGQDTPAPAPDAPVVPWWRFWERWG